VVAELVANPPTDTIIPPILATELVAIPIKSLTAIVLVPTSTLVSPGKRLIAVPATVIAGPPALSVCDEMTNSTAATGLAVGFKLLRATVLVPINRLVAPDNKLIAVPPTVIAGPPALSVWDEMTNATVVAEPTLFELWMGVNSLNWLDGSVIIVAETTTEEWLCRPSVGSVALTACSGEFDDGDIRVEESTETIWTVCISVKVEEDESDTVATLGAVVGVVAVDGKLTTKEELGEVIGVGSFELVVVPIMGCGVGSGEAEVVKGPNWESPLPLDNAYGGSKKAVTGGTQSLQSEFNVIIWLGIDSVGEQGL
jgi:hypothetical protein